MEERKRWRGFNLLDFIGEEPDFATRTCTADLKLMSDWGFNFIRLPLNYKRWTQNKPANGFVEKRLL
jgi:aryl-phospho-beta-D-glucosidase BglC (GH1 family)